MKMIRKATQVPNFLSKYKIENKQFMQNTAEFWLSPKETGSQAHMDEHCTPTFATALSGKKRWRLQHVTRFTNKYDNIRFKTFVFVCFPIYDLGPGDPAS